jgi:uncharacterized protein YdhG (YjbR/CyaY superfamily)
MPKNQTPLRTIESYIGALPPDAAFIMERVREELRELAPGLHESIKYDMPRSSTAVPL